MYTFFGPCDPLIVSLGVLRFRFHVAENYRYQIENYDARSDRKYMIVLSLIVVKLR